MRVYLVRKGQGHIYDHFLVYISRNGRIKSQGVHMYEVFRTPPGCPPESLNKSTLSLPVYERDYLSVAYILQKDENAIDFLS